MFFMLWSHRFLFIEIKQFKKGIDMTKEFIQMKVMQVSKLQSNEKFEWENSNALYVYYKWAC